MLSIREAVPFCTRQLLILAALLALASSLQLDSIAADGDCAIDGMVVLEIEHRPARGVVVAATALPDGPSITVLTDDNGQFHFGGLPSGTYDIFAEEPGGYESLHVTTQIDEGSQEFHLTLRSPVAPKPGSPGNSISVRELHISPEARAAFDQGLRDFAKRQAAKSLAHFRKAVLICPDFYEAYYSIGLVDIYLARYPDAIDAFQKAIDLSFGQYLLAEFAMGVALWHDGRLPEAEAVLRRAVEADPSYAVGHLYLSVVLSEENRLEEAEKSARAAALRSPKLATAYLVLASINARRGDPEEQLRNLEKYLALAPDEQGAMRKLYDAVKSRHSSANSTPSP